MSEHQEKIDYHGGSSDAGSQVAIYERPKGLKGFYYHPITQVVMLGFVCFMGPGTFDQAMASKYDNQHSQRTVQCPQRFGCRRAG